MAAVLALHNDHHRKAKTQKHWLVQGKKGFFVLKARYQQDENLMLAAGPFVLC